MNLTLKIKAALVTTLVVVATVSAAGGWLYQQQARDHMALLRSQQNLLADAVVAHIDHTLASHVSVLVRAARQLDAASVGDAAAAARFLETHALRPPFNGVSLTEPDGMVVANDPPNRLPVNLGDRDYFRQARVTSSPALSLPLQSRTSGRPAVRLAVPAFDAHHHFVGALVGELDLLNDSVLGELGRSALGERGHYEIVTRDATPVYVTHPDAKQVLRSAATLASFDDFDTQHDFITRRSLRRAPWELRLVIPAAEAHGPLLRARWVLLWSLLLTAVGTVLAVSAGLGWLMRPLETLWRSMREQRRSPDALVPIDTSANDERGLLAREFDGLMRELRAQRAELAAVSDTSPLGLFHASLDGRMSYVNDAYLRIHGFDSREQAAQGWLDLLPEAERDETFKTWLGIVNNPVGMHTTRRLQRADGRWIVLAVRSAPIIVDGQVQGHVGTVTDITERIEGERAMRTLTAIFDATTDFVVQSDREGLLTYMNPAARRVVGLAEDAPIGHLHALSFNPPETVARHAVEIVPTAVEKGFWAGETLQWDAQHREMPVSHLLLAHRDRQGRVETFSAILRDITVQKAAQQALHHSEAVLRGVTEAVPMSIAVFDHALHCIFANQGFEDWCGRPRDELLGRHAGDVLGADELAVRQPWFERALAGERVAFKRDDAMRQRHWRVDLIPLFDQAGVVEGFVLVSADISASRAEERRLFDLAHTDPLTQVLNRSGFERALALRAEQPEVVADEADGEAPPLVALLYIDLDRFKPINDQHGHAVGDQLLSALAKRLRALVRPSDTIARLGGDEFAIALDGLRDEAHAMPVAEKVVAAAEQPFNLLPGEAALQIGASVGVAFWRPGQPGDAGWADALERADAMLYRAKAAGRGRAVVADD